MAKYEKSQKYDEQKWVQDWMDQIDLGLKYKKKFSDCAMWSTYRDMYRGNFGDEVRNQLVINRTFSYIKGMVPRVYFRSPSISITPRRPEFAAHARVLEQVDNWLIQETKLKYTLRRGVLEAGITGIGPIKLGYDSEYGYIPEQATDIDGATITQAGTDDGEKIEYNNSVQPGMPWAIRARPDEIITPWGYSDPNDLPWIAHMILRPVEDVKQDQKYDKTNRAKIRGGFSTGEKPGQPSTLSHMNGCTDDFCLLYEIRDVKRKKFIVLSEGMCLLETEDTLQIDGLPWEFIIFNEDPEHFWPISDVKMFMPQQKELNEIRSYARIQRRHSILKFLYLKGSITPEELEKALSGDIEDIAAGIEIKADTVQGAIFPIQIHNATSDLIREQQQTEEDMRSTMGFSQNQTGNYIDKTNSTATEAQIVDQSSNIRSDERRDIVADVLSQIIRKWNQYIFKYWTKERVVQITGTDGLQYWISYTGAQLQGEYDSIVSPESGQPVTRQARQQLAQQMFSLFNGDPLIDQVRLRQLVLQQTDLIDPSWQQLIKPQTLGMTPGAPMPFDQAAQDPNVLGPQGGSPPGGNNASAA